MTKRLLAGIIVLVIVIIGASITFAQDSLTYGDTVTGELSDDTAEVSFTFEGTAGDVVVVEVRETEQFSDLNYPFLTLQDPSGEVVAQSNEFGFKSAVLVVGLQDDGTYTVIVSGSPNYEASETVGEFALTLEQATPLAESEVVSGEITLDDATYYLVESSNARFNLRFDRGGQGFPPITINVVNNADGELIPFAIIAGSITSGSIAFEGDTTFSRYVIAVGEVDIFDPEAATAQFELELLPAE